MSDDLAAQLVDAAADGMKKYICDNGGDPDDDWTEEARAAVVATLRAMADRNVYLLDYGHSFGPHLVPPGELADRIEQGDGA